jgi:hypothetical protein
MGVKGEEAEAEGLSQIKLLLEIWIFTFCFTTAEAEQMARDSKGENGFKGDSKFAAHLKSSTGVSSFSKTRTLKEQREYLPAFACREELMKVMRENQGLKIQYAYLGLTSDISCSGHSCW